MKDLKEKVRESISTNLPLTKFNVMQLYLSFGSKTCHKCCSGIACIIFFNKTNGGVDYEQCQYSYKVLPIWGFALHVSTGMRIKFNLQNTKINRKDILLCYDNLISSIYIFFIIHAFTVFTYF